MNTTQNVPFDALERLFHEPNRLAIISALVGAESGLTFSDLKRACRLTDGNLSRHLQTLEGSGVVAITKTFVGKRPQTTVTLEPEGKTRFLAYIDALEAVLQQAAEKLKQSVPRDEQPMPIGVSPVRT